MGAILILSVLWSADSHSVPLQIQANSIGPPIFLTYSAENIVLDDFWPAYSSWVAHILNLNKFARIQVFSEYPNPSVFFFSCADPEEIKYPEVEFKNIIFFISFNIIFKKVIYFKIRNLK